jgi:pimeloyl-ACP methyl ester carboxylesterase
MSYAPVNGLDMYYEVHGSGGRPLVLLHGALSGIGTSFGKVLPLLARSRQVIAVEFQAHGRTADIDRPLSTEHLADDVAALLRGIGVAQADVFGYSLGAGVAAQLGVAYPELVGKLVLASVSLNAEGMHPGLLDGIDMLQPEHLAGSPFQLEYAAIAPNPDDWPVLIEKVKQFDREFRGWPAETFAALAMPVLLVIGDSDIIRPEHAVELFRLLGGGVAGDSVGLPRSRLAVLPGTTHVTLPDRAEWLVPMIDEFLSTKD